MSTLNILINAYAVSPSWGSEPGMGWNWISNLAKDCNLYVITEGEWRKEIENAVASHPFEKHLHFYYLPTSEKVRNMCWNQGDWRFYYYYKQWQKKALKKAKEICKEREIDLVHQLNMVGFREPGYLWKLDKPLVWGPIGGMEDIPTRYFEAASFKSKIFLKIKGAISNMQIRFSPRINKMLIKADAIIAAVPAVKEKLAKYKCKESVLIPETGCYDLMTDIRDKRSRKDFHIIWVGRFIYTKRLDMALRTISQIKDLPNLHFHIVGTGNLNQVRSYKLMAEQLGIDEICEWHGVVENRRVHEMMQESDLFFFTSIAEATSTVVPEAINNSLPIVCFNTCGFGRLVSKRIGRTVELTTPEQSVIDFAEQIRSLYNNKDLLFEMSNNCRETLSGLLWNEKAQEILKIYKQIVIDRN